MFWAMASVCFRGISTKNIYSQKITISGNPEIEQKTNKTRGNQMREVYETIKDNETIRLIKTVYNYDGIIDEAYKIEHIYYFDYGRPHIVESYTNRVGADGLIERYNLKPIK